MKNNLPNHVYFAMIVKLRSHDYFFMLLVVRCASLVSKQNVIFINLPCDTKREKPKIFLI